MIYLDYAANGPVDKEVLDIYYDTSLKYYANPNSSHKLGYEARKVIDDYTLNIANLLNILPEEIIYTSGATESNNLAIKGFRLTSSIVEISSLYVCSNNSFATNNSPFGDLAIRYFGHPPRHIA